ncbi:MAG: hypothetical protein COB59_05800 [Rhodospirillaceae bacterium]|nr:MAG: hypothetical protein COB59_05800 [Rhodospirillaceae bacterium]
MRGLFMGLENEGLKVSIQHRSLWLTGARYLYRGDETDSHKTIQLVAEMNEALSELGLDSLSETPTADDLFERIEAQVRDHDVSMDFSRLLCQTFDEKSAEDIALIRKFMLSYQAWGNRSVDFRFILQQRDPLDHLASLHERFNVHYTDAGTKVFSGDQIKSIVLESHGLLKALRADLDEHGLQDLYIDVTLSDIVNDFQGFIDRMDHLLSVPFYRGMYVTPISVNKWPASAFAVDLLGNPQVREMAQDLGIKYPQPGSFSLTLFSVKSKLRRQYYEYKIIVDTWLNRVEGTNPINAKHDRKLSIVGKIFLRLFPSWRKQQKSFYDNMKKD